MGVREIGELVVCPFVDIALCVFTLYSKYRTLEEGGGEVVY